jgi:hypothetical protein
MKLVCIGNSTLIYGYIDKQPEADVFHLEKWGINSEHLPSGIFFYYLFSFLVVSGSCVLLLYILT